MTSSDRQLLERAAKDEAIARRAADILGPSSAAAQALAAAEHSRANGTPAAVIYQRNSWLVVRAAASLGEHK